MKYDLAEIRQFLHDHFEDLELETLCFDYFPQVRDEFAAGMRKGQKILLLIDYCQRRELVPNLLAAIRRFRTRQFDERFPEALEAVPPPPPALPVYEPRQVFISHAHQDAEFAHRLAGDLKSNGWRVWIAPDSIRLGEKWVEAIERGLGESGIFAAVLTPAMIKSSWARSETDIAIALEKEGKLRLIPLDVEPCDVPLMLKSYQHISFLGDYQTGLNKLLAGLEGDRAQVAQPPSPAPAPRRPIAPPVTRARPRRAPTVWWAAVLAALAGLAIVCTILGVLVTNQPIRPLPSTPSKTPRSTATSAPTVPRTATLVPVPITATPVPVYGVGLITYLAQDEDKNKNLYALRPDGTSVTLTRGYTDVMVLSVSPDSRFLAVAVSKQSKLKASASYPRFVEGGAGTSLLVISDQGQKQNAVVSDAAAMAAAYAGDGQLVVTVLEGSTVMYYVCKADGSDRREIYKSVNKLVTPTATATKGP